MGEVQQNPDAGAVRAHPLLSLGAIIPLGLAVFGLIALPAAPPQELPRPSASAAAGPQDHACPGPLQLPDDALRSGPDAALSLTAPSEKAAVTAVGVESDSSLLFGRVSASETQRDTATGKVLAPTISARDADGGRLGPASAAKDLGASALQVPDASGAADVRVAPGGARSPVSDVVQSTSTPTGDFRSAAVTRCAAPTTTATFLGAPTQVGDSSALILRNTTARPATASVQAWSEDGPVAMKGRSRVVVPAGEEKRVLLESIAPGRSALGVQVDVVGAPLVMDLQTTSRDGLAPAGVDIQSPLEQAGEELVVPGVRVTTVQPELVLLNTSGTPATASAAFRGAKGEVAASAIDDIALPPGEVVSLPVKGLPAGDHALRVSADQPVLAVVRSRVPGKPLPGATVGTPSDQVLATAAPALSSGSVLALPTPSAAGRLALSTTEDTEVTVVPIRKDGSARPPKKLSLTADRLSISGAAQLGLDKDTVGLSIVPDADGVVHGAWLHVQNDGAGGYLVSSVTVPDPPRGEAALSVRGEG